MGEEGVLSVQHGHSLAVDLLACSEDAAADSGSAALQEEVLVDLEAELGRQGKEEGGAGLICDGGAVC